MRLGFKTTGFVVKGKSILDALVAALELRRSSAHPVEALEIIRCVDFVTADYERLQSLVPSVEWDYLEISWDD